MSSSCHFGEATITDEISSASPQSVAYGGKGFPRKCFCGSDVILYTSQSKQNPGRPYFRCAARRENGHVFKWVDEATLEEVKDILEWVRRSENEFGNLKAEVGELKNMLIAVKEDGARNKIELKKVKVKAAFIFGFLIVLVVVLLYLLGYVVNEHGDVVKNAIA